MTENSVEAATETYAAGSYDLMSRSAWFEAVQYS